MNSRPCFGADSPSGGLRRRQVLLSGAAALAGAARSVRAEAPIVLGQSAPLTGPAAQLGLQYRDGARLYFDQVNAQGGIGRRAIELRTLDDGYEPDRCAENTRRLLDDDTFALFGYVGTPTSLAALPQVQRAKVPFFAPLTGAMALRQPGQKNVFHLRASYDDETAAIVKHCMGLGTTRIGVVRQNDSYGQAGLDGIAAALARHGLKPGAVAAVERNSSDVAAAVRSMADAKPDVVVLVCTYAASAAFTRAVRAAGYGGVLCNLSFVGTQALATALGPAATGVVVTQVVPSPSSPARQASREFMAAVGRSAGKVGPDYSAFEGYLAARLLVEGLRAADAKGTMTREGLVAGLESLGSRSLGGFSVAFGPESRVASGFVELSMLSADGRVKV